MTSTIGLCMNIIICLHTLLYQIISNSSSWQDCSSISSLLDTWKRADFSLTGGDGSGGRAGGDTELINYTRISQFSIH